MTREEAEKLVDDLVDATIDYENNRLSFGAKYHRQHREEARERVLAALSDSQ